MKPVSVLLWELSEKDITTLPEGFPVLRYDKLTESLTVLHAGMSRYLKDKFVTTERLNEAFGLAYWSNSIHDWEDFPDIRGCINGGLNKE